MKKQLSLFSDEQVNIYEIAKKRFGVWPLTVWNLDHSDRSYRELKRAIKDDGAARENCFTKQTDDKSVYRGKVTESIFNPLVALWALNCFAPKSGRCFDPFGGGGTRAILTARHGLYYQGIELRPQEAEAVRMRCIENGVGDSVHIITGDARDAVKLTGFNWADFLLTCPPYWNLEKYNGGESDLSMLPTYADFLREINKAITASFCVLRSGANSIWVVGLNRDKNGNLLAMNHDIAKLHTDAGFIFREEIVLNHRNTGAIQRVGNFEKGNRWLVRVHEYALVFRKP